MAEFELKLEYRGFNIGVKSMSKVSGKEKLPAYPQQQLWSLSSTFTCRVQVVLSYTNRWFVDRLIPGSSHFIEKHGQRAAASPLPEQDLQGWTRVKR